MNRLLTRSTWVLGIGTCVTFLTTSVVPLQAQDFSEATTWVGGASGDFMNSLNWDDGLPSPTKSALFSDVATREVSVTGLVDAWHLGAVGGETTLSLGPSATLTLQNDGYLMTMSGTHFSLVGAAGSLFKASTIETWGDGAGNAGVTEIAATVELDGGSVNHPVRIGRYAMVVGAGGEVALKSGADVSIRNETARTVVRIAETDGLNNDEGILRIEQGARLTIGRLATGEQANDETIGFLQVGDWGSNGRVVQTGGEVELIGALNIGNQGGHGVYEISNGSLKLGVASSEGDGGYGGLNTIGRNQSTSTTRSSHGRLEISGTGLVELAKGSLIIGNNIRESDTANNGGRGEIIQNGGTLRVGPEGTLFLSGFRHSAAVPGEADGVYELNGGVLEIGGNSLRARYNNSTSEYAFHLGGGTLRVVDATLVSSVDATLVEETTSTIDTGDFDATLGSLSGSGDLIKRGKGRLYLTGDTIWSGNQADLEGGLRVGSSGTAGSLTLEEGATVTLGVLNPSLATTLRVGIGGNRKGVLNIDGGHVLVKIQEEGLSNTISIGRDESNGIGDGELIMSNGSIIFDDEEQIGTAYGSMSIGHGAQGKGVFQHSGGKVDLGINGGVAFLVGYAGGDGTYHLSGDAEFYNGGGTIYIGDGAGGSGVVNVEGQSRFTFEKSNNAGQIFLGHNGGEGSIVQDGAGTEVNIYTPNAIHIGAGTGGTGTYELKDGTARLASDNGVALGEAANGVGVFEQSGGVLYVNQVEDQKTRVFNVGQQGEGRFTQSSGESHFGGMIRIAAGANSKGEVHLEGGIMGVGGENGISKGNGDGAFYFKGGTLKVEGAELTTSIDATLSNVSTIDTGGLGAEWSGILSGLGGLTKTGEGVLTLTAENIYQGTTTVEEGTLAVNGTAGTGNLVVGQDGALAGTGVVQGHATIAGALNPGNSPGTLTFADGLTLETGSTTTLEITGIEEGEYDQIDVSGGSFLVEGGTLVFSIGSIGNGNHTFSFFEGAPVTGSFDFVQVFQDGVTFELLDQGSGLWTYNDIDDPSHFYSFNATTGEFDYEVVPEPETWALLVGAGAALWLARRRRTRNAHV